MTAIPPFVQNINGCNCQYIIFQNLQTESPNEDAKTTNVLGYYLL